MRDLTIEECEVVSGGDYGPQIQETQPQNIPSQYQSSSNGSYGIGVNGGGPNPSSGAPINGGGTPYAYGSYGPYSGTVNPNGSYTENYNNGTYGVGYSSSTNTYSGSYTSGNTTYTGSVGNGGVSGGVSIKF